MSGPDVLVDIELAAANMDAFGFIVYGRGGSGDDLRESLAAVARLIDAAKDVVDDVPFGPDRGSPIWWLQEALAAVGGAK